MRATPILRRPARVSMDEFDARGQKFCLLLPPRLKSQVHSFRFASHLGEAGEEEEEASEEEGTPKINILQTGIRAFFRPRSKGK